MNLVADGSSVIAPSGARMFGIRSHQVNDWLPYVSPHLKRWIEHDSTVELPEVAQQLASGESQLWCLHKDEIRGVFVTKLHRSNTHEWGLIWGCAGNLADIKADALEFLRVIENWMKANGCEFVEIVGRGGWERILPDYKRHAVILRKRL